MIKFFFMALISGNLEGRPQVQFNTVSALPTRNVTSGDLVKIQDAAAQMLTAEGVQFDNIVIHNLVFLAECTEAEFFEGTAIPQKAGEEAAPAPEGDASVEAAETLSQEALVEAAAESEALAADAPDPAPVADDGDHSRDDSIV